MKNSIDFSYLLAYSPPKTKFLSFVFSLLSFILIFLSLKDFWIISSDNGLNLSGGVINAANREVCGNTRPPVLETDMIDKHFVLYDPGIRPALRSWLLLKHADESDTVLIEELGLCRGQVRVDVAVVNGLLHGYEIKSDRDSLRRLAVQVEIYGKVLDRVTLVVGERHLAQSLNIVPSWWGVLFVYATAKGLRFKTVRRARNNPRRDPHSLVELLWLEHAIALLEERNAARGVRGKPRHMVWDRVCRQFGIDEIAAAVRTRLKARATSSGPG